jgi:AMMECR1 domain-containing protein
MIFAALIMAMTLALIQHPAAQEPRVDEALEAWAAYARSARPAAMTAWLRCRMALRFGGTPCSSFHAASLPGFSGGLGVFVTIMKGRAVRGCYGAFHHAVPDFTAAVDAYLRSAMVDDPRHEPVGPVELDELAVVVTVAGQPFAVNGPESVDLARFGIMAVRDDGTSAVFVPAELVTAEAVYRVVGRESIVQCYAFRAVTIR